MPQPAYYQIRVEGELPAQWSAWFGGLAPVACSGGETLIAGWLPDQAMLRGVLDRIFDLNLQLLSVSLIAAEVAGDPPATPDLEPLR